MAEGVTRGPITLPNGSIAGAMICNQAVTRRALEDGSVSSIKISASLESENWDGTAAGDGTATQGWRIEFNTDNVEFNSGTFRGAIYATSGEISGDLIVGGLDAGTITAGSLTLTGTMSVDDAGGGTMIDSAGIRADKIYTGTLTALTYQTAPSPDARLVIGPSEPERMRFYNSSNTNVGTFGIDPSGIFVLDSLVGSTIIEAASAVLLKGDAGVEAYTNSVRRLSIDATTNPIRLYVDGALENVTAGATDSGGAGYRVLRVAN